MVPLHILLEPLCLIPKNSARSPELTTPDYSLWGYLEESLYINKPRTLEPLKENIRLEIKTLQTIAARNLQTAFLNSTDHVKSKLNCPMKCIWHLQPHTFVLFDRPIPYPGFFKHFWVY